MNVFELRDRLIHDYASYISSFIQIRDLRIAQHVERSLADGLLWPEPLIQLNPSFEPGDSIDELVRQGILYEECSHIFRIGKDIEAGGKPLLLHRHQSDAIRIARKASNYILTTGTGSGKSLAYIIPIVDHVIRNGSGRGIQAIIVYPMNALANSQFGELEKFLSHGYPDGKGPVTFTRYTGQEKEEERQRILERPPDILLTNYVMLELILTRPREKNLIRTAQGLKFLVLDELHTYRGRQGADVALLVRRVRDILTATQLQCVGTSATLAGMGTFAEQKAQVANVGSILFGAPVQPEHVIGETLRRATPEKSTEDPSFVTELSRRVGDKNSQSPAEYGSFVQDPLSIWIESTFGVTTEPGSTRLIRSQPKSISGDEGAAKDLSRLTGLPESRCVQAIQQGLLSGYFCRNPRNGFPAFAFRLHQFISRGDAVYASVRDEGSRYITVYGQRFVPGAEPKEILLPMVFCRECGQEYYCVRKRKSDTGARVFEPRDLADRASEDDNEPGYLYLNTGDLWPADTAEVQRRIPEDWLEEHRGALRIKSSHRDYLPSVVRIRPDGQESEQGLDCHFIRAPFRFCLNCGVAYGSRQQTDIGKLTSLGTGGRSTATTILSLSAIRSLRREESLPEKARKLLSFTDNRQDASLQAGHFNDFVEIGLLRSALYRAACTRGEEGLRHDELTQKVFDALALPLDLYSRDPDVKYAARTETERALRDLIGYRIYLDQRRGWRITSPNLEHCGYFHPAKESEGPDLCERCGKLLGPPLRQLLRLQNVSTRRRDKINSDEEERLRQGYEIISTVRFAEPGIQPSYRTAQVIKNGTILATLTYGHAATIWRVNLGWVRRKSQAQFGFVLDVDRGYWAKNPQDPEDDEQDPNAARTMRVIPYVEDRRNCLLFEPAAGLDLGTMASLEAAFKSAIQVHYQLEDSELAVESLPGRDNRKLILFYESAEGGAGVLRNLIDDPHAIAAVAREALSLMHFDPQSGADLRRAPKAKEDCEAACYDCLMSYVNQLDHACLDRHAAKDLLMELTTASVQASPSEAPRAEHLEQLKRKADSGLERDWLDHLEHNKLRLPSDAQVYIEACRTRPDFVYGQFQTVVYIDGPHHEFPERHTRDQAQTDALEDLGYTVIRFADKEGWDAKIAQYPHIFGRE